MLYEWIRHRALIVEALPLDFVLVDFPYNTDALQHICDVIDSPFGDPQ